MKKLTPKEVAKKMRLVCGYDIMTDTTQYRADILLASTKDGIATYDTQLIAMTLFKAKQHRHYHRDLKRAKVALINRLWRYAQKKRPVAVRKGLVRPLSYDGIPKLNQWSL